MNCDRAQAAISERMDGVRLSTRVTAPLETHLEGCGDCRAFADRASRVRTAVRIRTAEQIPDLVDPIMAEVARSARAGRRRAGRGGVGIGTRRLLAPVGAALSVGLIAGSLVVGGPWQHHGGPTSASAGDVIRRVGVAARHVQAYHATMAIREHGFSPEVPERSLEAELWFASPGRYRLDVHDTTHYPTDAWTPTDLRYVQAGTAVMTKHPSGCPAILQTAGCPATRSVVRDHSAYSPQAPLAADLVVPLDVLANTRGLTVVRTGPVLGRDAVLVRTTFARATPLFPFLQLGGTWRPFYGGDRVDLWVDARDWSPLRWTVFPSDDPARADWELTFGRLPDPPGEPMLDVEVTEADSDAPAAGRFAAARAEPTVPVSELSDRVGFHPVTPTATQDLSLTQAAAPSGNRDAPQSLITYSSGLTYLRVAERRHWSGSGLFGPVSEDAERVRLGAGTAYYEPADGSRGRRLAIHTRGTNLFLETNLSREDLLAVAASLPLDGAPLPDSWKVDSASEGRTQRLTLDQARAQASFDFDLPDQLPGGYVLASVEHTVVQGIESITITLRQRDSELAAGPIRVHLEPADVMPPASAPEQETVMIGGVDARWTPSQGRLEWIVDGVYRSIDGPGIDLVILGRIAESVRARA